MKKTLEIEINDNDKIVRIKDSGEIKEFKGGIHLVAADAGNRLYYVLSYGASADLGWAMAQAINDGWKLPFVRKLFFHFTEWINKFLINIGDGYSIDDKDLEAIAEEWEKEENKKTIN